MAKKFNLREFQTNLSRQLQAASQQPVASSRLGFRVGTQNWLVALDQTEEVIPLPPIVAVPGTQRWFKGMANIRGKLFAVTDFSDFMDGVPTPESSAVRLLIPHHRYGVNAALLVGGTLGLNNIEKYVNQSREGAPSWAKHDYVDGAGAQWRELEFPTLLNDAGFLEVELRVPV